VRFKLTRERPGKCLTVAEAPEVFGKEVVDVPTSEHANERN